MKKFRVLIAILLIMAFTSCKKAFVFSPSDLIGTWTQTQPYPAGSLGNQRYIFQFTSDSIIVTSPYSTRGAYSLGNDNTTITMDCVVSEGPSCAGYGSQAYTIATAPNILTLDTFFTYASLGSPSPIYNLYMTKTN